MSDETTSSAAGPIVPALGWWLVNVLQAVLGALWSVLWISLALLVSAATRGPRLALAMARRIWAPGMLRIGGMRVEVLGRERLDFGEPHFFASNHLSWIDIPSLFTALPVPLLFVGKRELARVPFLGWYMAATGMVFVDRGRGIGAARSVAGVAERLRAGWSVLSFPEGTRARDGRTQPFKSAGFQAAIESGVPVVPVAIEGADRVLPPDGFRPRPGVIRVILGRPIPTAGLAGDARADLARRTEQSVRELLAGAGRGELSARALSPDARRKR
jgi:1-acyl-sn-glycerol-3-phosphate acyltransferase